MKNLKSNYLLFAMVLTVVFFSCKGTGDKNSDTIVYMSATDSGFAKAKAEAQGSLNHFLQAFDSLKSDTNYQFSVYKNFVDGEKNEHMWVVLTNIVGDSIVGNLSSHPDIVKNIKYFDRVTLHKNQMEDWMIYNYNTKAKEGGFSEKVMNEGKTE
jgi:uncharacterized protein YegJ (DUF2314 family)